MNLDRGAVLRPFFSSSLHLKIAQFLLFSSPFFTAGKRKEEEKKNRPCAHFSLSPSSFPPWLADAPWDLGRADEGGTQGGDLSHFLLLLPLLSLPPVGFGLETTPPPALLPVKKKGDKREREKGEHTARPTFFPFVYISGFPFSSSSSSHNFLHFPVVK